MKESDKGPFLDIQEGCIFPQGIKSSHMKFELGSENHKQSKLVCRKGLEIFHNFCEANNLLYTIQGGSLMGYYWTKNIIYWDDDIDVHVEQTALKKICDIWHKGQNYTNEYLKKFTENPASKYGSTTRIVKFGNQDCLLCFGGGKIRKDAWDPLDDKEKDGIHKINFKIIPLKEDGSTYCFNRFHGERVKKVFRWVGMDINIPQPYKGKMRDSWFTKKVVPWFYGNERFEDFPISDFSGIKARAAKRDIGEPWLDKMYGKFWRAGKHELLKREDDDQGADYRFKQKFLEKKGKTI